MKTIDLSKNHKGEYGGSVAFCDIDGGYGEYEHTNKVTGAHSWEVIEKQSHGGYRLKVMTDAEYKKYKAKS